MEFFIFLVIVKCLFLGAVYGRIDGGGIADVKEWVERTLVMSFFVLACAPFAGLWALAAYLGVVGIATGHGQYFLAMERKKIKPEKVDFIAKLLFGNDPRETNWMDEAIIDYGEEKLYWRCVFGMFLTGTLVGIPAFVVCLCFGQAYGLLFLFTGVVKALAYMFGYKFFKSTEHAEYANGGGRTALCVAVALFSIAGALNGY